MSVIGHSDRAGPLQDYCVGLVMPGERKSVEPMAAVTAPDRTAAQHQSLLHFVGQSPWSDEKVLAKVGEMSPNEFCPCGRSPPLRRRRYAASRQNIADRLIRNLVAEIGQCPSDAVIAPGPVLLGHANDQVLDVFADTRPARGSKRDPSNLRATSLRYHDFIILYLF